MATEFKIPELGEGIDTADVADVLVSVGDTIESGQSVLELETEKAVMELPCDLAGKVAEIRVGEGDSVKVGQTVLLIEEEAEAGKDEQPAEPPPGREKERAAEKQSAEGGARKDRGAGKNGGDKQPAGEPQTAATMAKPARPQFGDKSDLPVPAGPATRRLARELGISLESLSGSGPGGRITQEDVARAYAGRQGGNGAVSAPPLPDFSKFGEVERKPLSKLARTSASNLAVAWQTIPHVTQHDLADVTELEAARRRYREFNPDGPKVTMTAIAVKCAVAALKSFPQFNASLDSERNELVLKRYFHIGVAVDTPSGLVVPVIRDADQKSLLELAAELTELARKARERSLELSAMQGGTFTITNLGGIGGTAFTPIVNYPEVAILGMSRTDEQIRLSGEGVEQRLMLPLSLSYDHRVVNGADAARFLVKVAGMFADSFNLLVEC